MKNIEDVKIEKMDRVRDLNKDNQSGITLIALVITVIILLILAGVAMSLITGQNGLFAKANHAGYEYDRAAQEEKDKYDVLDAALAQYVPEVGDTGNGGQGGNQQNNNLQEPITETPTTFSVQANATNVTLSVVPASVGADGTTYQYSISTDGTVNWVNPRISTDTSHTFTGLTPETTYTVNVKIGDTAQTAQSVTTASQASMRDVSTVSDAIKYSASAISATDTTYEGTYKQLTDANNDTVKIPVGFTVRYDSAATVNDGIVVADQNDNQWVWIPVNASNTYTRTWFGTSGQEARLKTSATDGEKVTIGSSSYDIYYEAEPVSTDVDYNLANRAGGYYMARYEAGVYGASAMRSAKTSAQTVSIQRDQVPYNYVAVNSTNAGSGYGDCITLSSGIATANGYKTGITTKLCSSYAWDTALNFIGNESWSKGTGTGYQSIRQNYYDSATFKYKKISNGVIVEDDKPTGDYHDCELVLTGQGNATKNIYDMGGNCGEYTTESCSNSNYTYVVRGGFYDRDIAFEPAGFRGSGYGYGDGIAYEYSSFRPTLYL